MFYAYMNSNTNTSIIIFIYVQKLSLNSIFKDPPNDI